MKTLSLTNIIVGLLGLMVYTNSSLDDYREHINQSFLQQASEQKHPLNTILGSFFGDLASSMIARQTVRKDYIFLSTYDTKLGQEWLRSVGILKQFFRYETPSALKEKF